jgi:hypothetical protein
MMTVSIAYAPQDKATAQRLMTDLQSAGYALGTGEARTDVCVPLISTASLKDAPTQSAIYTALDHGQHIIPVLLESVVLPKVIDHLGALDFTAEYHLDALKVQIDQALSPEAHLPLRVRTPAVQRSNRRTGLVVGAIALFMFLIGIYGVAVLGIQRPNTEFDAVETEVAATRGALIDPTLESYLLLLPGSEEEALAYPATIEAIPTRLRPFVAATATAVASE